MMHRLSLISFAVSLVLLGWTNGPLAADEQAIRVLNFQGDSGFQHDSKAAALQMVELLGKKNGWFVQTTIDPAVMNEDSLRDFDVLVFNNNCGTDKRVFSDAQQNAIQGYIRGGGGFVGIHCAGAIWHEGGEFQEWYERLIGTRLVSHPHVQEATLVVENRSHHCTTHLPKFWVINDEWHKFSYNPRDRVNVLISLDESTYEGADSVKMGGDHPFTWYQYYDGGRSFFTSLGHTVDVYKNADYQRLVEGGIAWAATGSRDGSGEDLIRSGLILDLDANRGVTIDEQNFVTKWTNQVQYSSAKEFVGNDYGMRLAAPGSGLPRLVDSVEEIKQSSVVVFREDELINDQEDAFDHLIQGSGYTWFAVLKPYATADPKASTEFGLHRLSDVNAFLGNLRNGGNYEGIWGCFDDDLTVWCGSRSGATFGRFDENNPKVSGDKLQADRFYVIAARMAKGVDTVPIELFVNSDQPCVRGEFPVNPSANPSRMAIGTERDATNHPGSESFDGEIARILIYERPISDAELKRSMEFLKSRYGLD